MNDTTTRRSTSLPQQLWLPVSTLRVDHSYQRPLDPIRVRNMAESFDPDALGTLTVSLRLAGGHWVIDGQHRVAMLRAMGWDDQQAPCLVHTGLTPEDEARIFQKANSARRPGALALFRAGVKAGEPIATDIDRIVKSLGLEVRPGNADGNLQAVTALVKIYTKAGSDYLEPVLRIIRGAWGLESGSYQAEILQALALVLKRYGDAVDHDKMRTALRGTVPHTLLAAARAAKTPGAGSLVMGTLPDQIIARYNQVARGPKRLPQWERRTNVREVWS